MKQNQSTDPQLESVSPATPKASKSGNVSMYTSSGAPDFHKNATGGEVKKASPKKKHRRAHHLEAVHDAENEGLDEALDDILDEESAEEIPFDTPEDLPVPGAKAQNLFSKIKERRERQAAQKMSALELIRQKSGFSEDDIAMMLELGYESELGRVVGYENLKKLKRDHFARMNKNQQKNYRTAFGYCGVEDVNEHSYAAIIATYMHDRKFLILRTLLTALATILLLFLDHPLLIGGAYLTFSEEHPLVFSILSLVLLLGASVLSWRQINAGLRSYFKLKPSPYSAIAALLPFTLVYDVIAFFTTEAILRVNFITAGILLLIALCDCMRLVCEMRTFRLLSAEGVKTVLEPTTPRKKKLRQGKKLVKIINDDIDESFYRVQKAETVTGFFRRFNTTRDSHFSFHVLLGLSPACGFLGAFITLLATANPFSALSAFMSVMMLAAPFTAVLSFFFPLCRANKLLARHNCTLVGDEAVQEFGESKTVIFADTDLYTAEKCTEIAMRESDDFRKDLRLAGILFRKIGGTLAGLGASYATKSADPSVAFVRIAEHGVEAMIDNQYHVIAGDADFLKKCGIRIPKESSDRALRRTPNVSIMYVAIDGVLKVSYEIEYSINPDFEELALDLSDIDTDVAIQSYDPNLNEPFLQISREENAAHIRVIKPGKYEADSVMRVCDTGAVALGRPEDIVYPLHAAKGIRTARTFGTYLQYAASAFGAVAATVLSIISVGAPFEWLHPLTIAGYHILCMLLTLLSSFVYLNRRTLCIRR